MTPLLLHEIHQAAGATFIEVNGQEVVAHYGNAPAEYQSLTRTAALLDLSFHGRLCLVGADAQKFLNGQVTNNVKELKPGQGCYAALVTAKGKMESDLNIYRLDSEMLLDFEPGYSERVRQRLEKFIIAEDAQVIDAAPAYGLLSLQGPEAAAILTRWSPGLAAPTETMAVVKTSEETYLAQQSRAAAPGYDLFIPIVAMQRVAAQFVDLGARWCGWEALEIARVEAGVPRFGADMDESNLAPEALGPRAISYAKGCYIGQEVIARIRSRGHVTKSLCALRLEASAGEKPSKGGKVYFGGQEAGYITSSAPPFALGYVRREANHPNAALLVETPSGKIPARIVEPPFRGSPA
jgi:folate-binding protein YgfZ